jgi:hypothetical protein
VARVLQLGKNGWPSVLSYISGRWANGWVSFKNRPFRFPKAFIKKIIALRPTPRDGEFDAFFRHQKIKSISLHGIPNETRDL